MEILSVIRFHVDSLCFDESATRIGLGTSSWVLALSTLSLSAAGGLSIALYLLVGHGICIVGSSPGSWIADMVMVGCKTEVGVHQAAQPSLTRILAFKHPSSAVPASRARLPFSVDPQAFPWRDVITSLRICSYDMSRAVWQHLGYKSNLREHTTIPTPQNLSCTFILPEQMQPMRPVDVHQTNPEAVSTTDERVVAFPMWACCDLVPLSMVDPGIAHTDSVVP